MISNVTVAVIECSLFEEHCFTNLDPHVNSEFMVTTICSRTDPYIRIIQA
jgi:hypothetical protein